MSQDNGNIIWRDIEEFPQRYQISDDGRARNSRTKRILCYRTTRDGYLLVEMYINSKKKVGRMVHRLVALAFIPNPDNFPVVNHKDGNKKNNAIPNLEWCITQYNSEHAVAHDLVSFGINHHNAKIDDNAAIEIIEKYATGDYSQRALVEEYGLTQHPIWDILHNKIWKRARDNEPRFENRFITHASSGFRGVYWSKGVSKWECSIMVNYKKINIGFFIDPEEAAYVYDQFAMQLHGDKAKLNLLGP